MCLKNIPANFRPDPMWNEAALDFFLQAMPQQEQQQDE